MARTGQCAQPSLIRARNSGPWVAAAACRTSSRHSARLSGGQRVLLALGGAARCGLAEVDQSAAPGVITLWQQAFGDGQLIHRQLGVALGVVLADRGLAGLDVDDHQPARAVAFEPVEAAAHPHRGPSGSTVAVDVDLGAHLGELVAGLRTPLHECRQHRAVPRQLVVANTTASRTAVCSRAFRVRSSIWLSVLPGRRPARAPANRAPSAHRVASVPPWRSSEPAQRAVGQRLQRRRGQRDDVVVAVPQRLVGGQRRHAVPLRRVGAGDTRLRPAAPIALPRRRAYARRRPPPAARTPPRAAGRPAAAGASTRGA